MELANRGGGVMTDRFGVNAPSVAQTDQPDDP
jgi:hypothetical protein